MPNALERIHNEQFSRLSIVFNDFELQRLKGPNANNAVSGYHRVSKIKLTPFIFKLASNLLLEFDNSHVYSQQDVGN